MNGKKDKLLRITEFSKMSLTTPRTLRLWQELGLLKPYKQDKWTGYRYYRLDQVYRVMEIRWWQELGLRLNEIKQKTKKKGWEKKMIGELDEEINRLQGRRDFLIRFGKFLSNDKLTLKRVKVGGWKLLIMKIEKGKYHQISRYVKRIWQVARKYKQVKFRPLEVTFYETPYFSPLESELKIGLIFEKGEIGQSSLPSGFKVGFYPRHNAYLFQFEGPYRFLMMVYQKLNWHFIRNKIKIQSPVFEMYLKGPLNTQNEYRYLTHIYYPYNE